MAKHADTPMRDYGFKVDNFKKGDEVLYFARPNRSQRGVVTYVHQYGELKILFKNEYNGAVFENTRNVTVRKVMPNTKMARLLYG